MGTMRKEVVIGLSTIAVLLGVFGALAYRRFMPGKAGPDRTDVAAARGAAQPITPPANKPTVVALSDHQSPDEPPMSEGGWSTPDPQSFAAESERRQPGASFLPQDTLPAQFEQTENTLTGAEEPATESDALPPESPASDDPFNRPYSSPLENSEPPAEVDSGPADDAAGEEPLPAEDDPAATAQNPLRRRPAVNQPTEAVRTSGEFPDQSDSRSGRRDRFAPANGQPQYDALDPPAGAPGQFRAGGADFAAPTSPVPVENGKYAVQPNDSYWTISEKVYGTGGYFKAIYEHNRLRFPRADKLQVGDMLEVPPASVLQERYADLCPKTRKVPTAKNTLVPASSRHRMGERVYVVTQGDTLFDIARYELGKAARWTEIYDLNRDVLGEEFDYLRPGTELVLPQDRRESDSVTRKGDPVYQR